MLKAYVVTTDYQNTGGVLFAKSNVVARRQGADLFNNSEFAGLSVKRAKRFDAFDGHVPASALIEEGWRFECYGCDDIIDTDRLREKSLDVKDVIGDQFSQTFCCQDCLHLLNVKAAQKAKIEEQFFFQMKQYVREKFPGFTPTFIEDRCYIQSRNAIVYCAEINFNFPGQIQGPAALIYETTLNRGFKFGPASLEFKVFPPDKDAFEKFADEQKQIKKMKMVNYD